MFKKSASILAAKLRNSIVGMIWSYATFSIWTERLEEVNVLASGVCVWKIRVGFFEHFRTVSKVLDAWVCHAWDGICYIGIAKDTFIALRYCHECFNRTKIFKNSDTVKTSTVVLRPVKFGQMHMHASAMVSQRKQFRRPLNDSN